jgi:hypothetical protein
MIFFNHKGHKGRSQRDTKVENRNWAKEDMHKKDPLLGEPVPPWREARGGFNNNLKKPISNQNKQRQIFIFLLFSLCLHSVCFCQEEKYPEMIVNIAEDLAAEDNDPEGAATYIEYLNELTENPVMINTNDETELSRLFFLSDFQVRSLADHIRRTGNIVSVYEIAAIPGFDQRIAEMMMPFISLKENTKNSSDTLSVRSTLITNVIFKPGEKDTSSLGSQLKMLTKYRISAGRFSAGFTAEKDAGEKYFTGSPPHSEFLSAYSSYSGKGIIRKLILGDFSLRFGAGTCINTSLRTGLRLTAPGFMTGRDNLRPYTSTDENNFFRGAAADLCVKNAELILFYSRNRIDATPELSSDSAILFISSIYKTGLHNTPSLLLKKDLLRETVYGISFSYNFKFIRVGVNWSETGFSIPLHRDEGDPESIYDFEGAKNRLLSVNYNTLAGRILIYGEVSVNNFSIPIAIGTAIINGVTLRPSDRLTINVLWRKYSPGFTTLNGKGPGNSSSSANEEGITGNFSFEAAKHLFISAGCDVSHYPWLKYRCSFPSMSRKEEILIRYLPSEKITLQFSFDHRYSMINDQKNPGVAGIEESESRTFKWIFRYLPAENSAFTTRIDYKMAYPGRSRGMLLFEDINYRFKMIPIALWFRYCLFSTETWDSRLYTYENDLLYSFSIPALSGEGSRSYIMVKFDLGHFGEMRIKYGLTSIIEKSGTESFNDELKLQFRIWF